MSKLSRIWIVLFALATSVGVHAEISLTLKQSFVKTYKGRATISAECTVDKTKGKANPASKDGDMHIAVRCPGDIGLPLVAEIMNAKDHQDVIQQTVADESSQAAVSIVGAWRIWNEHGGDEHFKQGNPVVRAPTTNPDHVFEIHPVSRYGDHRLESTFREIPGYKPKDAEAAFARYEGTPAKITYDDRRKTITITSGGLGYNYVNFQMQLKEVPFKIDDGYFAMAQVRDMEGHLLHRNRRMVFVEGTPPAEAVKDLGEGACLRVLGMPRLNLSLVDYRVGQAKKGNREPLTWNLPYEIIVVGVYGGECEVD